MPRPESAPRHERKPSAYPEIDASTGQPTGRIWVGGRSLDALFNRVQEQQRAAVSDRDDLFNARELMSSIPASRGKGRHQGDW